MRKQCAETCLGTTRESLEDMKQLKDSIPCPSTGAFEVTYPL